MSAAQRCQNCRFSLEQHYGGRIWLCRRRSPVSVPKPGWSEAYKQAAWPEVPLDGWCGEWAKIGEQLREREPETSAERMWDAFWNGWRKHPRASERG